MQILSMPHPVGPKRLPRPALVAVCPVLGSVLLVAAYHHAAGLTIYADQLPFMLYWAGFLGAMLPLAALACTTRVDDTTRMFALVGLALFGTLPKLLRNPTGPLSSDEFAHMRQIIEAFLRGDVGHASYLVPIAGEFPGLHQAVSAIAHMTGLPLWTVALGVIILAHLLSVLGAYQLVHALGASPPGAAMGAVVFTLNPSWVFFDAQVAYETLALPLLLWCLAAAVASSRSGTQDRARYTAAAVLAASATAVVHHLAAIILCLILGALTIASFTRLAWQRQAVRRAEPATGGYDAPLVGEHPLTLLVITVCALGVTAAWFAGRFSKIVAYLTPPVVRGWTQLSQLVGLSPKDSARPGERMLFAGAQLPHYELVAAVIFPPLVLVLILVSGYVVWLNRRQIGSATWVFTALAMTFFLSLPMLFTQGGSEGAHRSWAYSFIGIAALCGLARSGLARSFRLQRAAPFGVYVKRFGSSSVQICVAVALFTAMAVGGTAAGENVSSRFPGPPRLGDDMRSVSREGAAVTDWIAAHAPPDTPVLADRYVSQQVGSRGRMATLGPSPSFPLWEIYMNEAPIRQEVLKQLSDAKVRYLVVDGRMATARPALGFWFTWDEPGANGDHLFPASAIARFNCLPWLKATFAAGHLTVYEVDAVALRRTMAGDCRQQSPHKP